MVKRVLLSVQVAAALFSVGVSAVEIEPQGPAYYGPIYRPAWRTGRGVFWSQDRLAPGPRRYGAHPEWAEVFPSGPVRYGTNLSAATTYPAGPVYYGYPSGNAQAFPPGPVHYGQPPARTPYHGYPYPPCGPQGKGVAATWPRHTVEVPARQGGTALPPCAATSKPTEKHAPQPLRLEQRQAPHQASGSTYAHAPSGWQESYQQQGSMIYGPGGAGYRSFGHPSGTGATYERYGTMLYGGDRRCHLSGNTALCW